MCGCFGDIRGVERPAFSCARHALGGTGTLYEAFVCSEMGSVYEWCRNVHIDPAACSVSDVLCFLQYRLDSGLYHQHWKSMWLLLPCFVPRWAGNRSVGMRWWWVFLREVPWGGVKSSFTATTQAFSIRWYEGAISQKCTSSCPHFG